MVNNIALVPVMGVSQTNNRKSQINSELDTLNTLISKFTDDLLKHEWSAHKHPLVKRKGEIIVNPSFVIKNMLAYTLIHFQNKAYNLELEKALLTRNEMKLNKVADNRLSKVDQAIKTFMKTFEDFKCQFKDTLRPQDLQETEDALKTARQALDPIEGSWVVMNSQPISYFSTEYLYSIAQTAVSTAMNNRVTNYVTSLFSYSS